MTAEKKKALNKALYSEDVLELIDIYGQFDQAFAAKEDLVLKPTPEVLHALTATAYIQRSKSKNIESVRRDREEPAGAETPAEMGGEQLDIRTCPVCKATCMARFSAKGRKYFACQTHGFINDDGTVKAFDKPRK